MLVGLIALVGTAVAFLIHDRDAEATMRKSAVEAAVDELPSDAVPMH
jgi:hypothetical protein